MKALIDGDIICYSIAFAAKDEPVGYVLNTVKKFLSNTTERAECDSYQVYLSGTGNFRKDVAKYKVYKGNRKQEKPEYYQTIRDYLTMEKGAYVVNDREADDALGTDQTNTTVICTIDKDLKMIAGRHYNWNLTWLSDISQEEADKFFMVQWLTGDTTDNIAGCKGIGPKKAEVALDECTSVHQMHEVIKELYFVSGHDAEYMDEMAQLLWIQRKDYITYKEWLDGRDSDYNTR